VPDRSPPATPTVQVFFLTFMAFSVPPSSRDFGNGLGLRPINQNQIRADRQEQLEPGVPRRGILRSDLTAHASNHLFDRGPARKLTPGWVKIVVDIGPRSLRTAKTRSMFVCFELFSERKRAAHGVLR